MYRLTVDMRSERLASRVAVPSQIFSLCVAAMSFSKNTSRLKDDPVVENITVFLILSEQHMLIVLC